MKQKKNSFLQYFFHKTITIFQFLSFIAINDTFGHYPFILALSVLCVKAKDRQITEASKAFILLAKIFERKALQRQRKVYFTFKVMVTIMAGRINKKNIAENSTERSLKIPSDFQSPSNHQELRSSNEFDASTISACVSNILEKFAIKQDDIMGSFAEVFANNQARDIIKTSDETEKKLEIFNDSLTAYNKTKGNIGGSCN